MNKLSVAVVLLGLLILAPAKTALAAQTAPATAAAASGSGYAHPEWLVDASWLKQHLHDANLKVVALTPAADFARGHIPGAAQIDWTDLQITDTSDASVTKWQGEVEQKLTALGITPKDPVVIYDGGTLFAARLWWILDQLGHQDKRILNGGLPAWKVAGGELEQGKSTVKPAAMPYKGTPNPADLANLTAVRGSLGKSNVVLIDTRTKAEYTGGHIPGAINIEYTENARPNTPRIWKPGTDLRKMYSQTGATPDKEIITYCSTGVRSAVTYFTLRLIGYDHVKLYTGSWAEWSQHPELPKTKGSQP